MSNRKSHKGEPARRELEADPLRAKQLALEEKGRRIARALQSRGCADDYALKKRKGVK